MRRYRCSECGRDEDLTAIAYGYMEGTLSANGYELDDHSLACEDTEICEDTIRCPEHPDAPIHKLIDGTWHQWACCPVDGCAAGQVRYSGYYHEWRTCSVCKGHGGRDVPIEDEALAP